jgi:hypothetical protein
MGILQTLIDKKDELLNVKKVDKTFSKPGTSGTADDILTDEAEVERLTNYIDDNEKKKVINTKTGVKHGVEKIGTKNDTNGVLRKLLGGASKAAKEFAAKIMAKKWARENLTQKFVVKSGKEITGKMISKNIYIKEVVVTFKKGAKAGKTISYLQARNKLTGRVVSYKTAAKLIGKLGNS